MPLADSDAFGFAPDQIGYAVNYSRTIGPRPRPARYNYDLWRWRNCRLVKTLVILYRTFFRAAINFRELEREKLFGARRYVLCYYRHLLEYPVYLSRPWIKSTVETESDRRVEPACHHKSVPPFYEAWLLRSPVCYPLLPDPAAPTIVR